MDWTEFEKSLRQEIRTLKGQAEKLRRGDTASIAGVGAAVLVLAAVADAVSRGAKTSNAG